MASVTFRGVGPGTCSWCGKEKSEVFNIETEDFQGDLCRTDLCCYLRLKAGRPARSSANPASPPARDDASGNRKP
jgi:hypothetical protein